MCNILETGSVTGDECGRRWTGVTEKDESGYSSLSYNKENEKGWLGNDSSKTSPTEQVRPFAGKWSHPSNLDGPACGQAPINVAKEKTRRYAQSPVCKMNVAVLP